MPPSQSEFRLIIETPLPRDSRVFQEIEPIDTEQQATKLARFWDERVTSAGVKGWVQRRSATSSLWEDFKP